MGAASRRDYVQDKVREGETGNPSRSQPGLPGTGREGALGYVRYIAKEHMDKVREGETRLPQLPHICDQKKRCPLGAAFIPSLVTGSKLV